MSPGRALATTNGRRADPASMRINNMGLILRLLRDHGGHSRARIAAETGLSKATVSTLIGDLLDRRLVQEAAREKSRSVGRPGSIVTLDGRTVAGIGLEINIDYLSLVAVDLTGAVIREVMRPIDAPQLPVGSVLDQVGALVDGCVRSLRDAGIDPVAVTVGTPGFTDPEAGMVRGAPNLGWRDVPLADDLRGRLSDPGLPIHVQNDAKLGAVAEYALASRDGVHDLLYVTGDIGVGGGIISLGSLMPGVSGFSGEIGHMPLDPQNRPCPCGRTGCWERWVGLDGFLELVADPDDPVRDPVVPLPERLREVQRRLEAGDERARAAIESIVDALGRGLSLLADVLNPARIVLGGYFAWFDGALVAPVGEQVRDSRLTTYGESIEVVASRLGLTAAARGGAHASIAAVFADPTVVAKPA